MKIEILPKEKTKLAQNPDFSEKKDKIIAIINSDRVQCSD